jgi:hypothetical protein
VVSPEVPGGIALFESRTEADGQMPGIVETMTYQRTEPAEEN